MTMTIESILNVSIDKKINEAKKQICLDNNQNIQSIFKDISNINLSKYIFDLPIIEYPDSFFTKYNLFNTNYHDLSYHDYEKYFYFAHLYGFNGNSNIILKQVANGTSEKPVLIHKNGIFWLFSGNIQMIAYKLLGIFPVIRQVELENILRQKINDTKT